MAQREREQEKTRQKRGALCIATVRAMMHGWMDGWMDGLLLPGRSGAFVAICVYTCIYLPTRDC